MKIQQHATETSLQHHPMGKIGHSDAMTGKTDMLASQCLLPTRFLKNRVSRVQEDQKWVFLQVH